MKSCVPFFVWAFLVLGSWNYGSAWAQDVPPASATEALEHLADLVSRGKLGGANDDHPVSSTVIQVLSSSETEPLSAALAAFDTCLIEAQAFANGGGGITARQLAGELAAYRQLIEAKGRLDLFPQWEVSVDDRSPAQLSITLVRPDATIRLIRNYFDENSSFFEVAGGYQKAAHAIRLAKLGEAVHQYLVKEMKFDLLERHFEKRGRQWDHYFTTAIPQWPWENMINGAIYEKAIEGKTGSVEPPTFQVIAAHPDVVLEYVPDAEDGQQFKGALMVEVVGVNFWKWKDNGDMGGVLFGYPVGVGLVTTFTDRAGLDDWGYGGILHLNHLFNIGVTVRDGDVGYFVSANLARLFRKGTEKRDEVMSKIQNLTH